MKKLVVLPLALVLAAGCSDEPQFEGRPASYWREQLNSKDAMTRARAAHYTGRMGPRAQEALPDLIALLEDGDPTVRYEAAASLGNLGPDARAAVPALTKLLKDPIRVVSLAAAKSLERIDPEARPKP